jgi:[glutamine synthetase] adenylyltransferase / [glutamine synthetase]-adenylyl-L-tyrosine phosphorylase
MDIRAYLRDLPEPDAAARFFAELAERDARAAARIVKSPGLLSDVLAVSSYSAFLSATMLRSPEYIAWLERRRSGNAGRSKEEILESLGRFALTHSTLEPRDIFSRFRRRELLRIFLHDIRRLATIAEITAAISELADAILEYALMLGRQQLDNRFGYPQELTASGKLRPADICVVSLGKLGSRELNYASDIDLMFIYSADGQTSGSGTQGQVTNREYFAKLAETVARLVGQPGGEGAAYRVDLRLRPRGSVGDLAVSKKDAIRYFQAEARMWEKQVLIRSRASAGDEAIFKRFFEAVEDTVFPPGQSVGEALESVRTSKQMIDRNAPDGKGFNVKLGAGGIREIEFIAQALQLAYGGDDRWLRAPHTLISLSRLADRGLIGEFELRALYEAYDLFRRLEHRLQMENGLQTHTVPRDRGKREALARRMGLGHEELDKLIASRSGDVQRVFSRVFADVGVAPADAVKPALSRVLPPIEPEKEALGLLRRISPRFHGMVEADPSLGEILDGAGAVVSSDEFRIRLAGAASADGDRRTALGLLRRTWSHLYFAIAAEEIFGRLTPAGSKQLQTDLAEASTAAALALAANETARRFSLSPLTLELGVLGLGKMGGGAIDYDSDLDLLLVHHDRQPTLWGNRAAEVYARMAESFVNALSSVTREGKLYRVDLRLRPHGKSGPLVLGLPAFITYIENEAALWELLAYVKIRSVGGNALSSEAESAIRSAVHASAARHSGHELRSETRRIRLGLEKEKGGTSRDPDIKYGAGGMLDIYFLVRYLQLRHGVADEEGCRRTSDTLRLHFERGHLTSEQHAAALAGYSFLAGLDHSLRLCAGRGTRVPWGSPQLLRSVCEIAGIAGAGELTEKLAIHRMEVRRVFDEVVHE